MGNKSIYAQEDIDEKIEQFKKFQKEVEGFVESLEQMHQSAINVCERIKDWRNKNEK